MTQQELQQAYSRQNWQTWLSEIFGSQVQFEAQAENIDIDRDNVNQAHRFASVKLADGKNLAVLDIETKAGVQIARNRVGLRELAVKFIDHARYHGILAFYHNSPSPVVGEVGEVYRLSFISSEPKIDSETGTFSVEQTPQKRFTYVLGEKAKTKTPADRLKTITDKRGNATLEDIKTAFSVETLTKEFYGELSNWYFWALQNVQFPQGDNEVAVIRLITRLMFVWFIKQKHLVPSEIFERETLDKLLNYKDKTESTYYKAILQNLFFATLNTEMGDKRKFVNRQSGIQGFFRYERFFTDKERFVALMKNIPFLNGGLFENLDKNVGEENEIRIDCFSNRIDKEELLKVPDFLFFCEEKQVDLNKIYDTKGKNYKVRGLIDILKSYNFTIEENTPTDIEVALDPELLGKVFENLLASFNPETQTTARKQTGSFYTPREIVDYMVNESLAACLQEKVGGNWENDVQTISAINDLKILDPACGSGAFPMGILQKMVQILQKLDPDNKHWREVQKQKAIKETEEAYNIGNKEERQKLLLDIDEAFDNNASDYGRKLFLIENCIFGVDIQPIAVQIAKLRFFISLICEQTPNPEKPNLGIRPLPNLETKFVAANTLISLEKTKQKVIGMDVIEPLEKELAEVRHKHFSARTPETKRKYRKKDSELRTQIAKKLKEIGFNNEAAEKIASWNPYDQNTHAEWFDTEWMFGVKDGFDIVIGNPPYVNVKNGIKLIEKQYYAKTYKTAVGQFDLFSLFIEKALNLGKNVSFIVPKPLINNENYEVVRCLILKSGLKNIVIGSGIFENAGVESCIFLTSQNAKKDFVVSEVINYKIIDKHTNSIDFCEKSPFCLISTEISTEMQSIFAKMNDNSVLIRDILDITRGIEAGKSYKSITFKINEYKLLRGEDLTKYACTFANLYCDYDKNDISKFKPLELYFSDKILIRRVANEVIANFDTNKYLVLNSIYCGLQKNKNFDLKYVTSILNSKLINFWFKNLFVLTDKLFPYLRKSQIDFIPIPNLSLSQQQPLISFVDYMLFLKNRENANLTDMVSNEIISNTIEKVIDACVYELYFEDEIKTSNTNIISLLQETLSKISQFPVEQQIKQLYTELNDYKNEIRNRIILQETRSESVSTIIKSTEI